MDFLESVKRHFSSGQPYGAPRLGRKDALARIASKGVDIATVIDVGAAKGDWSRDARSFWPSAHLHLMEAKTRWRPELDAFAASHRPASVSIGAVSDTPGKIWFPINGEDYAGAAFKTPPPNRNDLEEIEATSIDHDIEQFGHKGPFAIKLDTHGTEIDILNGAKKALAKTNLICIETYNFIGQYRFPQMISWIEERGFRCADLSDPTFRPNDQTLWQIDFYFLREDHPTFRNRGFRDRTPSAS